MKGFEYKPEELLVKYPGRPAILLNQALIKEQRITPDKLAQLKGYHYVLQSYYEQMEIEENPIALKELFKNVTHYNFLLQEVWGFPQNENFHYWWRVPRCTCPKMDNEERYGTKYRIISFDCPVHGR